MDASLWLLKALLEATVGPGHPPAWRRLSVAVRQKRLRELLRAWPGLLLTAPDLFGSSYHAVRKCAATAMSTAEDSFPDRCLWTLEEALAIKWPRPER